MPPNNPRTSMPLADLKGLERALGSMLPPVRGGFSA